jgi:hypothetical protein
MTVPPLTFRLIKGAALTAAECDENKRIIRDFCDGLARLFEIVFNADGTLKNNTIGTASLQDRAVTQRKLDWLANFFCVASGVDNYIATISPTTDFTVASYGDGLTTGMVVPVLFTNANTGLATLAINGAAANPIKKNGGADDVIAGEILAGSVHVLVFDGAQWQIVSPLPDVAPGTPSNIATTVSMGVANTAAFIPYDNTIPQNNEGDAYADLDTTFTAKKATSKLIVDVVLQSSTSTAADFAIALFRDADPDALAVSLVSNQGTFDQSAFLRAIFDVGDTLVHTYKIRYGPTSLPATVYINQNSSGAKMGSTLLSSMTITEVSA